MGSIFVEEIVEKWKQFKLSEAEAGDMEIERENGSGPSSKRKVFRLLGYVWDKEKVNKDAMSKVLRSVCNLKGRFTVTEIGQNKFLLCFDSTEDYVRVKEERPWSLDRSLVVLKEFDEQLMNPHDIDFGTEDFWVHVLGLPLKLMTKGMAKAIGNAIGLFREVDCDENDLIDNYVRIKVSINLSKPLSRGLVLKLKNGSIKWIAFQYERLPRFCFRCGLIGHFANACIKDSVDEAGMEVKNEYGNFLVAIPRKRMAKIVVYGRNRGKRDLGKSRRSEGGNHFRFRSKTVYEMLEAYNQRGNQQSAAKMDYTGSKESITMEKNTGELNIEDSSAIYLKQMKRKTWSSGRYDGEGGKKTRVDDVLMKQLYPTVSETARLA